MKRKRVWRIVSVALIVVWAVVIFSFSAQPDTESSEISGHVSYRIVKMWNQVFGWKHSGPELEQMAQKIEYPVRKAAHMSEYAVDENTRTKKFMNRLTLDNFYHKYFNLYEISMEKEVIPSASY